MDGFKYQVGVTSEINDEVSKCFWSISSEFPDREKLRCAYEIINEYLNKDIATLLATHEDWWLNFWDELFIQVPETILQKQWYLEQYKFGSAARAGAPTISLQAVWTADNGKLPPWKGDFHHELNTQLSYWPSFSANHLDEEIGFIDWLWNNRAVFKEYTKKYYETEEVNVPGLSTLTGQPMGSWIQYAFSPTVTAWLGHHFYFHWRYSIDHEFLIQKAYPWISDVAIFLTEISKVTDQDMRKLPISSSPEIYNSSRDVWFLETTNYDLSLIRWTYEKASELAL